MDTEGSAFHTRPWVIPLAGTRLRCAAPGLYARLVHSISSKTTTCDIYAAVYGPNIWSFVFGSVECVLVKLFKVKHLGVA